MTEAPTAPVAKRSANAALLRDLIRAQVSLQRVQMRLFRRDVLPALLRAEREIRQHVQALELGTRTLNEVSRARIDALLSQVQKVLVNAGGQASSGLTATLADVANRERRMLVATAKRALPGILPATFTEIPVGAIAAAGELSGAEMAGPWFQKWSAGSLAKVKGEVELGMVMGFDMSEIERRVRAAMGSAVGDAQAITRTSVAKTAAVAKEEWLDSNKDVWKGQQWVATLDSRTCPTCGPLDGKVWTYKRDASAEGLVSEMPEVPRHPNCRCTRVPVAFSLEELEARARGKELVKPEPPPSARASQDGEVAGTLTWDDWLADQPEGVQLSILGPKGWKQWKSGGLLESFSPTGRRLNAQGLRRIAL